MQKKLLRTSVIVISTVLFATTFANVQASQGRYTVDQCQGEVDRLRTAQKTHQHKVNHSETRDELAQWQQRLEAAKLKQEVHAQMGRK